MVTIISLDPRFGYGFEFSAGLGVSSTNSYEYSGGGVPDIRSYEVKEKLDFIGLGYLLDFAVLGDLEENLQLQLAQK